MAILKRAKVSIAGLPEDLQQINQNIGTLAELNTETKTSLVAAVNEVAGRDVDLSGLLRIDQNLADLGDVAVARTNLEVMSATEVADAIQTAKLAIGANHTVADITERDALADLGENDRVMVQDDGDGKWAIYTPSEVVDGEALGWVKLMDQDSLENAISAPAIKAAYESNEDTNAFTDAEKAKLGEALVAGDIATELDEESTDAEVASAAAVVNYVQAQVGAIGPGIVALLETVVVTDGAITLTHAPAGGVNGIMNFGTVRYIDNEGVAFDAPVVATGDARVFNVSTDTAGQWDGNSVQVQYVYEPVDV